MTSSAPRTTDQVVVLYDGMTTIIEHAHVRESDLWITLDDVSAATRWELKPEGLCRDEVCIPIPPDKAEALVWDGQGNSWLNLTGFARHLEQALVYDTRRGVWSFGPPQYEWQNRLASQRAPDFTLPDFEGK